MNLRQLPEILLILLALIPPVWLFLKASGRIGPNPAGTGGVRQAGALAALFKGFLGGLVALVLALGALGLLRYSQVSYLVLGLENSLFDSPGLRNLPGLGISALVEECGKMMALILIFHQRGGKEEAQTPAREHRHDAWIVAGASAAGLVFALGESLLFALSSLPVFMIRLPGTMIVHTTTFGILAKARLAGQSASGLVFTLVLHLAYNILMVQEGWLPWLVLPLLGWGIWRLLFDRSQKPV